MKRKGYMKTVEAVIAAGMIFIFSTVLIANPLGIVRKADVSDLKALSADALRVADKAMYDSSRSYMEYYLTQSAFPPEQGDALLKALYDTVGQGLPANVRYKLIIEGSNNLGEGATISIGPEPSGDNVVTVSYLKSLAGFLSAAEYPPIGVLAAVDDQGDVDFLCATVARAEDMYPDIQINFTMIAIDTPNLVACDGTTMPRLQWQDFNNLMTGNYFVYLFEDLQKVHVVPGQVWTSYKQDIYCVGNVGERKKGIIFGPTTFYYVYTDPGSGWNDLAGIVGLEKGRARDSCAKITDTGMKLVPTTFSSVPPDSEAKTYAQNFKIAQYHFITRDFLKGDVLRYNDLWKDANGNPVFVPAVRPAYWPCIATGEGAITGCATACGTDDDYYCRGLFSLYVSYDISPDASQDDREVWYELATLNDIEGTYNPDVLLPGCGYTTNENRAAILKQVMPESADYCTGARNLCGRYAINLVRLGRSWNMYMLYYKNWGQIKEPAAGGNGTIDESAPLSGDDTWDTGLSCYATSSCGYGSPVDEGAIIVQPGPNGRLDTIPNPTGDDQELRDTDALEAAQDLTTLMFEEIVWAAFWDTPFEYRTYKLTLILWYVGGQFDLEADVRRWSYA